MAAAVVIATVITATTFPVVMMVFVMMPATTTTFPVVMVMFSMATTFMFVFPIRRRNEHDAIVFAFQNEFL